MLALLLEHIEAFEGRFNNKREIETAVKNELRTLESRQRAVAEA